MALKLGKCRLCLKLGDFYSIFTMDNSTQLSDMVMECARVKVYEGDGLPDKICSECIQKLSGAYIFKQQCERSDSELRRNYVPPPGFSISPPPNRQSSDSAFSSAHTDISSHQTKANTDSVTPDASTRKRSRESVDNASVSSRSHDYRPSSSKRVEELRSTQKKRRTRSPNNSMDSDYEDNRWTNYSSAETDSDEPLIHDFKCKYCIKSYKSVQSLAAHMKVHSKEKLRANAVVDIPKINEEDAADVDDKLSCEKCSKTFKLKIMYKRHLETCGKTPKTSPQKELLISLEPIDAHLAKTMVNKQLECEYCTTRFKTVENLDKHLRVVHAAVSKNRRSLEPKPDSGKMTVSCLYCQMSFDDYYVHCAHFRSCPDTDDSRDLQCTICHRVMSNKSSYLTHIKNIHFWPKEGSKPVVERPKPDFVCRMCNKKLAS